MIDDAALIRKPRLEKLTDSSFATLRRMMLRGEFPRPVQIGPRAVGWRVSEVKAWLEQRPAANVRPPQASPGATK